MRRPWVAMGWRLFRRFRTGLHAAPERMLRRLGRRGALALLAFCGLAAAAPAVVWAGTPGRDPANGSWVGGIIAQPGHEQLVLWNLPGSGGAVGTCVSARVAGPLRGPYSVASTMTDPVYGELNHRFASARTSDVRLAELSALNSAKYDGRDRAVQWSYLRNGAGGTSVADAQAMLAEATRLAGPYSVSVQLPANALPGIRATASLTVRAARGAGVPQARVTLTASGATLPAGVTTDASGRATFSVTPGTATATSYRVSAAVQSWTAVRVYAAPGEQRMLSAAPPTAQSGTATGRVIRDRDVALVKVAMDDPAKTPVPGYRYRITDAAGRVVATVTTGSRPTDAAVGALTIGAEYTATELSVPPGAGLYIPAARSFTFTVPAGTNAWTVVAADPRIPVPALRTKVNLAEAIVGQVLSDTVTVSGNDGEDATISATRYGPVPPPASGRCADVTLAQWFAGPSASFTALVPGSVGGGNGDVVVTGTIVTRPGCYGWAEVLTLRPSGATATSPPTAPEESTLVTAPSVRTQVSHQVAAPGATLTDDIAIDGLRAQPASVTAVLHGPLLPVAGRGCGDLTDVDWRAAVGPQGDQLVAGRQTLQVPGDGTYRTAGIVIRAAGCYTYAERLVPSSTPSRPVVTSYGVPSESTTVVAPTVVTQVSANQVGPGGGTVTDQVSVSGMFGHAGTVQARLLGPVPSRNGSCAGLSWAGALVAGTPPAFPAHGDGTYRTAPLRVSAPGCYTFVETLVSASAAIPPVTTAAGLVPETFLVRGPAAVAPRPLVPQSMPPGPPLARTGVPVRLMAAFGAALALAGATLVVAGRRRRGTT
ncbi:MAG: hypothetical protein QOE97_2934 [Pseudonocardiales bacterium]|nr:hypothetical protein [Pseudonocardiales bacterium]